MGNVLMGAKINEKVSQTNKILSDHDARFSKVDEALLTAIEQMLIANAITMSELSVNFSRWFEEEPGRLFKALGYLCRNVTKATEARMQVGLARSTEYRARCQLQMAKAKARLERELARKKSAEDIAAARRTGQAKTNADKN
jgi:hypothetical protein